MYKWPLNPVSPDMCIYLLIHQLVDEWPVFSCLTYSQHVSAASLGVFSFMYTGYFRSKFFYVPSNGSTNENITLIR